MLHYITPWYYIYLIKLHIFFCHEGWDKKAAKNVFENKNNINLLEQFKIIDSSSFRVKEKLLNSEFDKKNIFETI